jgi:hypothetical protein
MLLLPKHLPASYLERSGLSGEQIHYGHLEELPFPRVRAQVGAVEAMSLNCWVPLETEFFEVPLSEC